MRYLQFRNRDTDLLEAVDVLRVVRFSQERSSKTDEYHTVIHVDDGTELPARGKIEDLVSQADRLAEHAEGPIGYDVEDEPPPF